MSGFVIKKGPPEFVIPEGRLDDFFAPEAREGCLNIPADMQPDAAAVLYLLPSAFLELDAHIHWKIQARINQKEQGGMMVGEVFRDLETEQVYGIVRHLIPSEHAGDATYLQFTHEDWSRMLRTYEERFHQREGEERLRIIGWYHTHPNMPTHMSQIDQRTHSSFWGKEWQFSVILNPQRGSWEVFNGMNCGNCRGLLYYDSQWEPTPPPAEPERDWSRDWSRGSERNYQRDPEQDHERNAERNDQRGGMKDPEQRERELDQRERDLERRERELERREMSAAPASEGAFIIKRGPEAPSETPAARRVVQHAAPCAVVECRCQKWLINGACFYLPYHDMNTQTQLLMPDWLVQKIWRMTNCRDIPRQASFSLTCQAEISKIRYEDQTYQTFMPGSSLYAEGFEYEDVLNGRLCFQKDVGGTQSGNVILTALFSETLPDYPVLCEKYGGSHVLLWYNVRNLSDFLYFDLRNSHSVTHRRTAGFQIKNRPPQEPALPQSPDLRGWEIFNRRFEHPGIRYISTKPKHSYKTRRISVSMLDSFLRCLNGYTAMPGRFCAAVGYSDEGDPSGNLVIPNLPNSSEIVIFLEDKQCVRFGNFTPSAAGSHSRFLFVLTNHEVDAKWLKRNVPGYATAFVVNLGDQSYHFYPMC